MSYVGEQKIRINDSDREQWINQDEGLYQWWKSSGLGMRAFIRANRDEIDVEIASVLDTPPH